MSCAYTMNGYKPYTSEDERAQTKHLKLFFLPKKFICIMKLQQQQQKAFRDLYCLYYYEIERMNFIMSFSAVVCQ